MLPANFPLQRAGQLAQGVPFFSGSMTGFVSCFQTAGNIFFILPVKRLHKTGFAEVLELYA